MRRILDGLTTVLVVVTLMFIVLRVLPGDPADMYLGDFYTPELAKEVRQQLGLEEPIPRQYLSYLSGLASGDWGRSYRTRSQVFTTIVGQYRYTLELTVLTLLVSAPLGLVIGVSAGVRRNSHLDIGLMSSSITFVSAPSFLMGLIILWTLSVRMGWFPMAGAGDGSLGSALSHLALPVMTQALRSAAVIARMARSSIIDVMQEDYVRTARAKGLMERVVTYRHALRNSLISVITVVGIELSILLGGAAVTETVFSRPGIGRLLVQSILSRDYPSVQGAVLCLALMVVATNLLTDLMYGAVDPRVRVG